MCAILRYIILFLDIVVMDAIYLKNIMLQLQMLFHVKLKKD